MTSQIRATVRAHAGYHVRRLHDLFLEFTPSPDPLCRAKQVRLSNMAPSRSSSRSLCQISDKEGSKPLRDPCTSSFNLLTFLAFTHGFSGSRVYAWPFLARLAAWRGIRVCSLPVHYIVDTSSSSVARPIKMLHRPAQLPIQTLCSCLRLPTHLHISCRTWRTPHCTRLPTPKKTASCRDQLRRHPCRVPRRRPKLLSLSSRLVLATARPRRP